MPHQHEPFDEGDDFNVIADRIRRDVADAVLRIQDNPVYRSLKPVAQVECVMAGLSVALIGCCFAQIRADTRDEMMRMIVDYLPQAREQADGILSEKSR